MPRKYNYEMTNLHKQRRLSSINAMRNTIQKALAETVGYEWMLYEDMHRAINSYLTDKLGKNVDLEFITLNENLALFSKAHPIEWMNSFLRLAKK